MNRFHFDVDEAFAKQHNEMLRDTRKVVISGVSLFVICVAAVSYTHLTLPTIYSV